jgi:magnesium transporter
VELQLYRTASGETHRRRPTLSEGRHEPSVRGEDNDPHAAENDVCYPQSDEESSGSIDFEELEEFVAETKQTPTSPEIIPTIRTEAPTPNRRPATPVVSSDEDFTELEKPSFFNQHSESVDTSRRPSQPETNRRWWSFFSSDFDDAIHSTTIGGLLEDGETFQQLFELRSDGGCWWLDGLNATEEEVTALCKAFGVHPLTREDICTQESREKVELFKKYYFVSFRSFNQDKDSEEFLEPVNVYAVVFRNGILSFTFANKNPHTGNVLKRIGKLRDYMQLSADWIAYAFIDDIVDSFNPFVHNVEQDVDAIEDQVFSSRPEDARLILKRISDCRKRVLSLLRLLGGKSDVIKGFAKRCNEGIEAAPRGDVGLYLSDIQDHVVTMRDNLTHSEQLLGRVHNNYLAQVNVDHISSGNRVNKVLSKITLLASILVPLNLVTGLFGMNVGFCISSSKKVMLIT